MNVRVSRWRPRLLAALLVGVTAWTGACTGVRDGGSPAAPPALRVMTYNIFAGNDLDRRSNLARVAALIDSLGVDVVLLQEVDRSTARSGGVDQAAMIAQLARLHVVFGRSMDFDGGEYGNAILSRWPLREPRVVALAVGPSVDTGARGYEPRSVLHVVVDAPGGAMHVLNTHLDHRPAAPSRQIQALQLLAYVAEHVPRDRPVVLGGDFNARPDAPEVRAMAVAFRDAWQACGAGNGDTFRADAPDRRIDYVLLAGVHCSRAWVPALRLSDHRPVVVDLVPPRD